MQNHAVNKSWYLCPDAHMCCTWPGSSSGPAIDETLSSGSARKSLHIGRQILKKSEVQCCLPCGWDCTAFTYAWLELDFSHQALICEPKNSTIVRAIKTRPYLRSSMAYSTQASYELQQLAPISRAIAAFGVKAINAAFHRPRNANIPLEYRGVNSRSITMTSFAPKLQPAS